jgi:hypothetical protein
MSLRAAKCSGSAAKQTRRVLSIPGDKQIRHSMAKRLLRRPSASALPASRNDIVFIEGERKLICKAS